MSGAWKPDDKKSGAANGIVHGEGFQVASIGFDDLLRRACGEAVH